MVKYVLCLVTILLLVVDAFIYFDLKKYIKVHENELVENHIKGLLGRAVAKTVISVCGRNSNYYKKKEKTKKFANFERRKIECTTKSRRT